MPQHETLSKERSMMIRLHSDCMVSHTFAFCGDYVGKIRVPLWESRKS